jgi:hypothetical protein
MDKNGTKDVNFITIINIYFFGVYCIVKVCAAISSALPFHAFTILHLSFHLCALYTQKNTHP